MEAIPDEILNHEPSHARDRLEAGSPEEFEEEYRKKVGGGGQWPNRTEKNAVESTNELRREKGKPPRINYVNPIAKEKNYDSRKMNTRKSPLTLKTSLQIILAVILFGAGACADVEKREIVALAEKVIRDSTALIGTSNVGFSGERSHESVALLILMAEPNSTEILGGFLKSGSSAALYGLIGLRILDSTQEAYRKMRDALMVNSANEEIQYIEHDHVYTKKIGELVSGVRSQVDKKKIPFGKYAFEVFEEAEIDDVSWTIDSGLLPEQILNPYMRFSWGAKNAEDADLQAKAKNAEIIAREDLLTNNPKQVLRMWGFGSEEEILRFLQDK